jgi:release factor glutamine methyltransferase
MLLGMQPQLLELVKKSAEYLVARGIENGRREAEWIFSDSLGLSRLELYTRFDMPLENAEIERLRSLIVRRGKREPLAYVLGTQEFCGLRLTVGPGVLVPRPETEELLEAVLAEMPSSPCRVLDIGTGSGAIALAIKHQRPDCQVLAIDRSLEALAFARRNAQDLGLAVEFLEGHLASGQQQLDLVIANLPYIADSERPLCDPELAFEPAIALYADDEGLALIREVISDAPRFLAGSGQLWLEHGYQQGARIRALCAERGLECQTRRDGAGHERMACIRRLPAD